MNVWILKPGVTQFGSQARVWGEELREETKTELTEYDQLVSGFLFSEEGGHFTGVVSRQVNPRPLHPHHLLQQLPLLPPALRPVAPHHQPVPQLAVAHQGGRSTRARDPLQEWRVARSEVPLRGQSKDYDHEGLCDLDVDLGQLLEVVTEAAGEIVPGLVVLLYDGGPGQLQIWETAENWKYFNFIIVLSSCFVKSWSGISIKRQLSFCIYCKSSVLWVVMVSLFYLWPRAMSPDSIVVLSSL